MTSGPQDDGARDAYADSDAGAPRRVVRVRKRDGRVVDYDSGRIRTAVARAQEAVKEVDERFPGEVEEVVGLALASRYARRLAIAENDGSNVEAVVPDVEEIQDLVEQALIEMGRARLAKAYILYRDRRARARSALEIVPAQRGSRAPQVRRADGTVPWSQAPIVAALMAEAELPRELAETVAERVEQRVLDAGLRYVATPLVRELVDNELLAMGLAGALRRQEQVGLPRHDLRRLLRTPRDPGREDTDDFLPHRGGFQVADANPAERVVSAVGAAVLTRYALDEVLDEASAESHRVGDLHFEDLAAPHSSLVRSVPVDLLLRGEPSPERAFELLDDLGPLLSSTAYGVVLEGLGPLVHALLGPRTRRGEPLQHFLTALSAMARASGRRIAISTHGEDRASSVPRGRALLAARAALLERRVDPLVAYMTWGELEPLTDGDPEAADAAAQLLARGAIVPVWHGSDTRWVAPGCRRRAREGVALACMGAVAIHLPRLARRAGPWREDLMFEAVAQTVEACIDGLERFHRFQDDTASARDERLRERSSYAITPVGLAEALRILGDGEERVEQGARLLGLLAEAVQRFADPRGLSVELSPFFGARARARMALLDRHVPRADQRRLFEDLPVPESPSGALYSSGFSIHSSSGVEPGGVLESRLLTTVPVGAVFPVPAPFRATGASAPSDGLAAWSRFHALRQPGEAPSPRRRAARDAGPLFHSP